MPFIPNEKQQLVTIINDGFFPDIDLERVVSSVRIDKSVDDDVISHAVTEAIIRANYDLSLVKARHINAGVNRLSDVAADFVNQESVLVFRYNEAVSSWAKALILEAYKDTDTTVIGDTAAELKGNSVEAFKRRYHEAINRIAGKPKVTVELI